MVRFLSSHIRRGIQMSQLLYLLLNCNYSWGLESIQQIIHLNVHKQRVNNIMHLFLTLLQYKNQYSYSMLEHFYRHKLSHHSCTSILRQFLSMTAPQCPKWAAILAVAEKPQTLAKRKYMTGFWNTVIFGYSWLLG